MSYKIATLVTDGDFGPFHKSTIDLTLLVSVIG